MEDKNIQNQSESLVSEEDIILGQEYGVTLAGKRYSMRRLTTRDVFTFSKLITRSIKHIGQTMGNVDLADETTLGLLLMSGLAENDEEIGKFYGSLIGMSEKEFMEQEPEFLKDYLEELPKQQDMAVFMQTVLKATQSLGALWQRR